MQAEGASEAVRIDLGGKDREVGRVKDAIAECGENRKRQKHPIGRCEGHQQHSACHGDDPEQHQTVAAPAVNQNADEGLTDTRDAVEQGNDEPECRVADAELDLEQWEQRTQDDLIEVRKQMRESAQANHQRVGTSRNLWRGHRPIHVRRFVRQW